jgi:acyl-CoA thioesterase-1
MMRTFALRATAGVLLGTALIACAIVASMRRASAASGGEVLIEAYGDSTTRGVSCSNGHCGLLAQNAVTWLQDALRADLGERVSVTNFGVPGAMAYQLRDGVCRPRCAPWKTRVAQSHAQIVMFNYGINDAVYDQTPDQFYRAETELVEAARAAGKLPVLETSNPLPDREMDAKLAALVDVTRRVAAQQRVPLVDQYAYIKGLPDWRSMMSDGEHPKPELYRLKAREAYEVLDPLVRQLLEQAS